MMRELYRLVVWMHPPEFRRRFGDEMLSIFDEGREWPAGVALLIDGITSLARQWMLRKGYWKIFAAASGAFVQVWGFGWATNGRQVWTRNEQPLAPYMEQLFIITLAVVCSLFLAIASLALWLMWLQRRRLAARRPSQC